ncbi:OmpA family protein [Neolewinella maritima]|uniref:OmpA family protein n=1 Tax=Neolewinella maritima TaxID=1383882 RepID=UPI001EE87937|nr:OmpA family protein [Neolewinella maritima]
MFISTTTFGQERSRQERAIIAFDAGVQHILDGKLKRAGKSLQQAVDLDSTFLPARRMLGLAHDLQDDYPAALTAYEGVLRHDPHFSRLLYYQTGEVYLRSGQPRTALTYFFDFRDRQADPLGRYGLMGEREQSVEQQIVKHDLAQRILSAQLSADSSNYVNASGLYNLGSPINTVQNDYFPFFSNDQDYLLYTRQGAYGDEDLIEGRRRRPERGYSISRFGSFNTSQPEGMCTLERDGETIFFTMCHDEPEASGCDIHRGILTNGKIEQVKKLPNYLNSSTWDSQAAISCDGQQLFFASTRPGGIGGSDLYFCTREPDGNWSEPRNLGAAINTPEDEEAPFLSNDSETLYFSSMGHAGMGDQDIFFSRLDRSTGRWAKAINIGPPINSPARELGFHLTAGGRQGYFASDRPGGEGGLDIYGFTLDDKLTGKDVTYVSGYVTDSLTGAPIVDQRIPVTGSTGVYKTNYAGRFFICAPPDQALPLTVDHADYLPYRRSFDIPRWDNLAPYRIDLRLQQQLAPAAAPPTPAVDTVASVAVEQSTEVYFAFESAQIGREQREAIDALVAGAGGVAAIDRVVLLGYTDQVGTEAYNLELSRRRAQAVGTYLQQLGVAATAITVTGRGKLEGEMARKLKRRVEVVIGLR